MSVTYLAMVVTMAYVLCLIILTMGIALAFSGLIFKLILMSPHIQDRLHHVLTPFRPTRPSPKMDLSQHSFAMQKGPAAHTDKPWKINMSVTPMQKHAIQIAENSKQAANVILEPVDQLVLVQPPKMSRKTSDLPL